MKKDIILLLSTVLLLGLSLPAQATTYYHFENYGDAGIVFPGSSLTSYSWVFDLEADLMDLWVVPALPLTNEGTDWDPEEMDKQGSMGLSDILHQAYLTMKFTGLQNASPAPEVELSLDLDIPVLTWELSQGGLANQSIAPEDSPGTLNVFSYLQTDHTLIVQLTSAEGGFTVEKMNLAGCFQTYDAQGGGDPVPEPGTLVLLGMGLAALAVRKRNK